MLQTDSCHRTSVKGPYRLVYVEDVCSLRPSQYSYASTTRTIHFLGMVFWHVEHMFMASEVPRQRVQTSLSEKAGTRQLQIAGKVYTFMI